nr:hypothetical protein [Salmonella enterica]
MTTITREQQKQILIDTANHVISRDNTSPYSENLRELARIALAQLIAEPVERDGADADPVVFTDERNLHHIARGRETSLIWGKQNQEVGISALSSRPARTGSAGGNTKRPGRIKLSVCWLITLAISFGSENLERLSRCHASG